MAWRQHGGKGASVPPERLACSLCSDSSPARDKCGRHAWRRLVGSIRRQRSRTSPAHPTRGRGRRCSVSAKGVPARCKGRCSCRRSRIRSTGTRIRSTGTRTPTTWPRRAEALASAASARVCVTRSLAASWRGAPRSAARRRRWSSGSLAVARASRVRSGRVHPLQGPIALSPFAGVSARRFETCARRCAESRRDERGQPSRPAMAPRGCRRRYSSSPVVSRPLAAAPERRDAGAPGHETSEAAGGDQASLQCLGRISAAR